MIKGDEIQSLFEAVDVAKEVVARLTEIEQLCQWLRVEDMTGLECAQTVRVEELASKNASDGRRLAMWILEGSFIGESLYTVASKMEAIALRNLSDKAAKHYAEWQQTVVQQSTHQHRLSYAKVDGGAQVTCKCGWKDGVFPVSAFDPAEAFAAATSAHPEAGESTTATVKP